MDTGPGYNTKRQEASDAMMQLFAAEPQLIQVAGDLLVRNMDFPGSDVIADRMAVNNPLAQLDDMSDIPPAIQMKLKQGQAQVQALTQQLQQMQLMVKQRQDIEGVKQEAETKRELMRQTAKAHDIEMTNQTRREDTKIRASTAMTDTITKTETQKEIEQMKAQLALVLAHLNRTEFKEANAEAVERAI